MGVIVIVVGVTMGVIFMEVIVILMEVMEGGGVTVIVVGATVMGVIAIGVPIQGVIVTGLTWDRSPGTA